MGCDIHWYSETKQDGAWACDQTGSFTHDVDEDDRNMDSFPNRGRDYWLFGLLANGVRTDWDWAFEQKGIPADLSPEVEAIHKQWDCDAHSASWLTRTELKAKLEALNLLRSELLIDTHAPDLTRDAVTHHAMRLAEVITGLSADVPDTDQRIVFWFDN